MLLFTHSVSFDGVHGDQESGVTVPIDVTGAYRASLGGPELLYVPEGHELDPALLCSTAISQGRIVYLSETLSYSAWGT